MHFRSGGCAETLGSFYFQDLRTWVKELHGARLAVVGGFAALLRDYDAAFPRSRLRLYPRHRPLHGPTALYWGEIVQLPWTAGRAPGGGPKYGIWHKNGNFNPDWAYKIAGCADRVARFRDFERRRLALNDAHKAVLKAFDRLRMATLRRFPRSAASLYVTSGLDPELRREVPPLPEFTAPGELPAWVELALAAGWQGTFSLGLAEEEASALAVEVRENPSADALRISLLAPRRSSWVRELVWRHDPTGTTLKKLTERGMRKLHIREGVRPVLALKERKRRRLEAVFARTGGLFDAFRKSAQTAQLAVAIGLAEARVLLLPAPTRGDKVSAPAAG